jgi:hypothetical protein
LPHQPHAADRFNRMNGPCVLPHITDDELAWNPRRQVVEPSNPMEAALGRSLATQRIHHVSHRRYANNSHGHGAQGMS